MTTYLCGQCVSESVSGCVRIESRFSSDEQVITVFSPEGARFLARSLLALADDAEKWSAPDTVEHDEDADPGVGGTRRRTRKS